jgi:hypothetical protein
MMRTWEETVVAKFEVLLRNSQNYGDFFTGWVTISFSAEWILLVSARRSEPVVFASFVQAQAHVTWEPR